MSDDTEWSGSISEVPPGTSAKFPLRWRGQQVEAFVVNHDGRFYAYVNRCIHAGTPLDWWPNEFFTDDGRLLICATHGALYEPATGQCAGGPCGGGRLYPLAVRTNEGRIIVSSRPEANGS